MWREEPGKEAAIIERGSEVGSYPVQLCPPPSVRSGVSKGMDILWKCFFLWLLLFIVCSDHTMQCVADSYVHVWAGKAHT